MTPTPPRKPLAWPWSADTPLDRARRVAGAYRSALARAAPEACDQVDTWARDHGQDWVTPTDWPYDDDELITRRQVADLCHVRLRTVYTWHRRGLPYTATVDGVRVRVADLLRFEQHRRQSRRP